jgi:hypothetical protein
MAEGRLTVSELEERLDKVYAAKTFGDLEPVTRDLPVTQPRPVGTPPQPRAVAAHDDRIGGQAVTSSAIAVMSGTERKGVWVVPPTFTAFAMWGGVEIDLTQARFEDGETTIQAFALMGGIDIVVPEDITVHVTGVGFMGAFEDHARVTGPPGAPVVKVTGFAMWAGVDVKRAKRKSDPKQLEG